MRNEKPFNKNSTVSNRSKQWLGAAGLKEYIKGYHNIFIQNIICKKTALIVKPHDIAKCRTLFQKLKKLVRIFCCAISLTSKQKLNINELTSIMMQILAQPNLCAFSLPSAVSFSNQKITKNLTFSNRLETKIKKKDYNYQNNRTFNVPNKKHISWFSGFKSRLTDNRLTIHSAAKLISNNKSNIINNACGETYEHP